MWSSRARTKKPCRWRATKTCTTTHAWSTTAVRPNVTKNTRGRRYTCRANIPTVALPKFNYQGASKIGLIVSIHRSQIFELKGLWSASPPQRFTCSHKTIPISLPPWTSTRNLTTTLSVILIHKIALNGHLRAWKYSSAFDTYLEISAFSTFQPSKL